MELLRYIMNPLGWNLLLAIATLVAGIIYWTKYTTEETQEEIAVETIDTTRIIALSLMVISSTLFFIFSIAYSRHVHKRLGPSV